MRESHYIHVFPVLLCLLIIVSAVTTVAAQVTAVVAARQDSFYTAVTRLLQEHVQDGQVNYKALQKDKEQLQRLVRQTAVYNLENASASERKAFYLNAYNLLVLHQVLAHYPINSVMDVPGFFDERQFQVAGEKLTLNQLEKQKLMALYQDARIHFALVCAAKSCPPLLSEAYVPGKVEEQLESQAKQALQDADFVKVLPNGKKVLVSELFKWYKEDFLRHASSVPAYINRYRSHSLPTGYTLGYYPYNWALNDTGR